MAADSTDDTWHVVKQDCALRINSEYPLALKADQWQGWGKGDCLRAGIAEHSVVNLSILEADISLPLKEIPRLIDCITKGKAEFVNGSHLLYGMGSGAMPFPNLRRICFGSLSS